MRRLPHRTVPQTDAEVTADGTETETAPIGAVFFGGTRQEASMAEKALKAARYAIKKAPLDSGAFSNLVTQLIK